MKLLSSIQWNQKKISGRLFCVKIGLPPFLPRAPLKLPLDLRVGLGVKRYQQTMCTLTKRNFGRDDVNLFTLRNPGGMEVDITNFGGTVVSVRVPDRNGNISDVVLGYDTLEEYITDKCYFGSLIGRVANRIDRGKFTLNGKEYSIFCNNGNHSLHGGEVGFHQVVWNVKSHTESPKQTSLELSYLSKNGESNYPGNLTVKAIYTLTYDNQLRLDMSATTDEDTLVNLTNHTYFNLTGSSRDILDHQVAIYGHSFIPINEEFIPTGEVTAVNGTPMDFSTPTAIGARINQNYLQLKAGLGYDHCWILSKYKNNSHDSFLAAIAFDPSSGRLLEVFTTEPGIQFYTGNFLTNTKGKGGNVYLHRYGFCFETEHYPNAINHPNFKPSIVLKPGEEYKHTVIYKFTVNCNKL